jgi:hypothetical protein
MLMSFEVESNGFKQEVSMTTRLLYHAFAIRGYEYIRTKYQSGEVIFTIAHKSKMYRCQACGSRDIRPVEPMVSFLDEATRGPWACRGWVCPPPRQPRDQGRIGSLKTLLSGPETSFPSWSFH